ncbi:hypothetical protein E2C01_074014 [Portunus trituberculatus]|uniref:Uncharacterized protein n=1 Tax=Portunus trituberculatus TaxID=210409 RepID=A0A5B7IC52_PORTR|nr:hypothetical protein [Portunus trituberculatus]
MIFKVWFGGRREGETQHKSMAVGTGVRGGGEGIRRWSELITDGEDENRGELNRNDDEGGEAGRDERV